MPKADEAPESIAKRIAAVALVNAAYGFGFAWTTDIPPFGADSPIGVELIRLATEMDAETATAQVVECEEVANEIPF